MKAKKLADRIIAAVFILSLLVPLLFTRMTGAEASAEEKRMLAAAPTLIQPQGGVNPAFKSEAKSWFEDHIGFRPQFVRLASDISFYGFRRNSSERVKPGSNGWYYYNNDSNLQIATGEYPLSEEVLAQILRMHLAIRDELAERGIEYMIILPTSKISIYPEYAPVGDGTVRVTPVDIVADYLEQNSDLRFVRLKDTLLEEKEKQQVYFRTDTHWTLGGAYAGYCEIIRRMNEWGLCSTGPAAVSYFEGNFRGEFGSMLGVDLGEETSPFTVIESPKAVPDGDEARTELFRRDIEAEGIQTNCFIFSNDADVDPRRVMFYGDSMFGGWNLPELFAENFSEFSYVWTYDIRDRLVEDLQPDIVIYEITERYLNYFPNTNGAFLADAAG